MLLPSTLLPAHKVLRKCSLSLLQQAESPADLQNQPLVDMEWTRQTAAALDLVVQLLGAELSLIEGGKVPFGPFMDIHQVNSVNLPWMAERRVAIATDSTLKQECDLELELLGDTVIRVQKENWQKQSLIQELTHEGQVMDDAKTTCLHVCIAVAL